MASRENPAIQYIYPEEGAMLWLDSMVIPKGAAHVENACKFINFILRPDIAGIISTKLGYATPNIEALMLMEKRNNFV